MNKVTICLILCGLFPVMGHKASAQESSSGLPSLLRQLFGSKSAELILTPSDASLQVSRLDTAMELTNAYHPSGIRYFAIRLKFVNRTQAPITVNTKASKLRVGQEELLRVQVREELQSMPIMLPGQSESDVELLQGDKPIVVPPKGRAAYAWLVFAQLPKTRELPPLILRLETVMGQDQPKTIDLQLSELENAAISSELERLGPSGRVGIARIKGELNALNVSHFARMIAGYAEQGVSRLVISFAPQCRIGDELTLEWLTEGREADNDRLQYYPLWSGLVREVVFVNVPGQADETETNLTRNEADAIQRVTRDLITGLDSVTLHREIRSGHPLFQRAILLNAGEVLANDDCGIVLGFLNSTDTAVQDPLIRQAAIQSLRAANAPAAITALVDIVRHGPRQDAVLALKSLVESQQTEAQERAIQLASMPEIQTQVGLVKIMRSVGASNDERWIPFLQTAFQNPDPLVRVTALEQLLQTEPLDRLLLMQSALADKHAPVRELAFEALVRKHSQVEQPLFVQETLSRFRAGKYDDQTLIALREIRDPSVLPVLLEAIDKTPFHNLHLVTAYVEIGGTAALSELIQRSRRFENETQLYVLRAFFSSRHPARREIANAGLMSDDSDYFQLCRWVLTELGDAEAVTAMRDAMQRSVTSNHSRSLELAQAIGIIGSPEALQALSDLRTNEDVKLQDLAEVGLQAHRSSAPVVNWIQAASNKTDEGDFEGAIQLLNLALELDTQSSRIYNSLGFAQLNLSRNADAKVNFEKALRISPEDHNPLTGIAICVAKEGRYHEAIQMVDTEELNQKFGQQQVFLYNVACVYGRSLEQLLKETETPERALKVQEFQTKALHFLNSAVEQNFRDLQLLERDPDLNSLRELPEFKTLPDKIEKRMENF